jgi:polysaccharide export outer membrane protein
MSGRHLFGGVTLLLSLRGTLAAQNPPAQPPPASQQPVIIVPSGNTAAQQAAAGLGHTVTNEQIANAIAASGLTEAQVRAKLQAAGYDPTLADPFFASRRAAAAAAAGAPPPDTSSATSSNAFANALAALGIFKLGLAQTPPPIDTTKPPPDTTKANKLPEVFGKDIFNRASTAFDPVISGPVDPGYRLGVGDALQLVVTGQTEQAYQLQLGRDGTVVIPQVGQIALAGMTLDAARTLVRLRMSKSFSGLATGEAHLDLTIAQLRTNAVFVIGEVENPGAQQVNSLATVFNALARAGGPTNQGSFRAVEVRRAGKVIERLDLYDYLLQGSAEGDIRLEQGDVIFVPLNTRAVSITGAVRRERTFQLTPSEGFDDLLRFSGGLLATASSDRVQIDRVLPVAERLPGVERVKVDVELKGNLDTLKHVPLLDGDIVTAFSVSDLRRRTVALRGEVYEPGEYELSAGLTLGALIGKAQGAMPWGMGDRVKVLRQIKPTGRAELFSVDATTATGKSFALQEFDSVEVLDRRKEIPSGTIVIDGAVNAPDTTDYVEHESLRDAIERAGGLAEYAQAVDVFRKVSGPAFSDTTTKRYAFNLSPTFDHDTTLSGFILERDDHVFVRVSPGFRSQVFVKVEGYFTHPGSYAIAQNADHIRDVVMRAGLPLPGAYPASFHLIRGDKLVSVDFDLAMKGDPIQNITLLDGDRLDIERDPTTVFVTGAVNRPSLIRYRPGLSVGDYIELAGGPLENGEPKHAFVDYPSGFTKRVRPVLFLFHTSPDVISGTTITVPLKPDTQTNTTEIWARIMAGATAVATLVIAYHAVK